MSSTLTEYDIEQMLYKLKANENSDYLKENGKLDLLEDYQIKSFKEYMLSFNRGEDMVNSKSNYDIEEFEKSKTILPELGDVVLYESPEVSMKRKTDAIMSKVYSDTKEEDALLEYSIIPLNDDGSLMDLVIDKDGNDLGIITYDEKGNPSFEISENLKSVINERLDKANVRSYVDEQTIQEEFYLKDINSLVIAIEKGIVVPDTVKAAGERAAAAKNIKNKQYTTLDAQKTIIQTPEEKEEKLERENKAREKLAQDNRLDPKENERSITEEKREDEEVVEEPKRNIETQPKLSKTNPDDDRDEEEENKNIPEDKKNEIEKICDEKELSKDKIKAVLIIKDPSTLADCTKNSHINRKGNEVTVIQFSSLTGKERYIMLQDGVELGGERFDRDFRDLIAPLKSKSGVYKRVEDNENYIDYTDSSGELKTMQFKRVPVDLSRDEKEFYRERIEIDLKELEDARKNEPENVAKIDELELKVYEDFKEAGLIPQTIKEDAEEIQEIPEEKNIDDDDCYDEIGRRIRPH